MEEYGWLIECDLGNGPLWWEGGGIWNRDSNSAIRFARKIDAEKFLSYVPPVYDNESKLIKLLVTDHMWTNHV